MLRCNCSLALGHHEHETEATNAMRGNENDVDDKIATGADSIFKPCAAHTADQC